MHGHFIELAALIMALVILGIFVYLSRVRRKLLRLRIDLDKAWAGVDALLKQQHDELPKLLGTCRGYMPQDHPAFELITRARTDYLKALTLQEKSMAHVAMTGAVEGLFKIAGGYPGLASNNNFTKLRKQQAELENNIDEQQELFNHLVHHYNRRIRRFPDSLAARRARLEPREAIPYPEMDDEA
jgi:LemA protein